MLEEQVLKNEANDLSESREDGESDDDDVAAATQYGDGAAERQDGNVTAGDGEVENVLDEQEEDEDAEGAEVLLRLTTVKKLFMFMRNGVDYEDTNARLDCVKRTYADEKL